MLQIEETNVPSTIFDQSMAPYLRPGDNRQARTYDDDEKLRLNMALCIGIKVLLRQPKASP